MVTCSRFRPALLIAGLYGALVPAAILIRLGKAGWHWVWNEPAFGFFMVIVFPFAVAVFSCIVQPEFLREAVARTSWLNLAPLLYAGMLVVLSRGVYLDLNDPSFSGPTPTRLRQPYMLAGAQEMRDVAALHDKIFTIRQFDESHISEYRRRVAGLPLSRPMSYLFMACNFINVGFGISVFSYIFLLTLRPEKIGETTCNHLVYVLSVSAIWFPCRAYAEWYMNLRDTSWIGTYAAYWVILALLAAACVMLAIKMVQGTLYQRYVVPVGVISGILGALAAFKGVWLSRTALVLESFDPIYKSGLVLIAFALLSYLSMSVHQKAT
jgi:hypothetical protein